MERQRVLGVNEVIVSDHDQATHVESGEPVFTDAEILVGDRGELAGDDREVVDAVR